MNSSYDVIVLGGGAAGLMAAATAAERGRNVLLIEVSNKLGKKILMSGGGRCNFTNLEVKAEHFLCHNPHFVKSALQQYSNWDFIGMVASHGVDYHEKDHGQLFCDHSSKDILNLLTSHCDDAGVECWLNTQTLSVKQGVVASGLKSGFVLKTSQAGAPVKTLTCDGLIVATGGLSIPTLGGATGFGYQLADQFGLTLIPRSASLVPFTLTGQWQNFSSALSGVSVPIFASVPSQGFAENLLFTHRGLSGPAILQLSNYWALGETIELDLIPGHDIREELITGKNTSPNIKLSTALMEHLPKSLVLKFEQMWWPELCNKPLQEIANSRLMQVGKSLHHWRLTPSGTEGYRTAEVTKGGVKVDAISSQTMQHKRVNGLFFVGEVLDVTGHLGGFNFQWAWSSGYVAGRNA